MNNYMLKTLTEESLSRCLKLPYVTPMIFEEIYNDLRDTYDSENVSDIVNPFEPYEDFINQMIGSIILTDEVFENEENLPIERKLAEILSIIQVTKDKLFKDTETNFYNKFWMRYYFLSSSMFLKEDAMIIYLEIDNFYDIKRTFGRNSAKYFIEIFSKFMKESGAKIVRFSETEFVFISIGDSSKQIEELLKKFDRRIDYILDEIFDKSYPFGKFELSKRLVSEEFKQGEDFFAILQFIEKTKLVKSYL